jgi:FkbM family methyltransferase
MSIRPLSILTKNIKNRIKALLSPALMDGYMQWRLSPSDYRSYRIKQYEMNYDGSIVRLGRFNFRLHQKESVSRNLYADSVFSGDVVKFLKALLPHSKSFIDVGANIGSISVPIINDGSLPALAIEPVADNYKLLQENLRLNNLLTEQVQTLQAAVGDFNGISQMYLSPNNSGDHRIGRDTDEQYRQAVEVPIITLDQCLQQFDNIVPPYLIKVDVQGYEAHVLRGSTCMFVIELWPWGLEVNGTTIEELEGIYKAMGLDAYVIRFSKDTAGVEYVTRLQSVADEIPDDWGAHLELLITNQSPDILGLNSLLSR